MCNQAKIYSQFYSFDNTNFKRSFCFSPPMILFKLKEIFNLHYHKVISLYSKYLGEGRETWFWVSEVVGGSVAAPSVGAVRLGEMPHLPWGNAAGLLKQEFAFPKGSLLPLLLCSETHI